MKKILVVCMSGLGSSAIMEMTISRALKAIGKKANIAHTNLNEAQTETADIYVCAEDLAPHLNKPIEQVIVLKKIIDVDAAAEKLNELL